MGVMSCHRNECENIMCDTYVDSIGYVCDECQKEFKDYLSSKGINLSTEGDIRRALEKFMRTPKGDFDKGDEMNVDTFFKNFTKRD